MRRLALFGATIFLLLVFGILYFAWGSLETNNTQNDTYQKQITETDYIRPTNTPITPTPFTTNQNETENDNIVMAWQCTNDAECGGDRICKEFSQCPPCAEENGRILDTCKCTTFRKCIHEIGPCESPNTLQVNVGAPFTPDLERAQFYLSSQNNLSIKEEASTVTDQNGYFVVDVLDGDGSAWIDKMTAEGFSNVSFYRTEGCDIIGN